jgi:hypothetical protein
MGCYPSVKILGIADPMLGKEIINGITRGGINRKFKIIRGHVLHGGCVTVLTMGIIDPAYIRSGEGRTG